MAKKLPESEKKYLLSLNPDEITFSLLVNLFSDKSEKKDGKMVVIPARIEPYWECSLEKGEYFNKERVERTTAGQIIYNKIIVERELQDLLGYIDYPITGGELKKVEEKLSIALKEDKITVETFAKYLDRAQWLGMQFHPVLTTSFTMNTLKPNKKVVETRRKLLEQYKDEIERHEVSASVKIEKELLAVAEKELKGDPGLLLYESEAKGSFGNNFKNISVMKGPMYNPAKGHFDTIESNFMEGIKKTELPNYGTAIISGAYPKAIGTGTSGYFSKQILATLQSVVLDEKGTDCHSKVTIPITLTKSMKSDFIDRYIVENGKLVVLSEENFSKYVGKTVNLRSRMFCINDKVCNVCAGDSFYKLGITNIGLTGSRIASTLLNMSMKKFHDATTKMSEIELDDMII